MQLLTMFCTLFIMVYTDQVSYDGYKIYRVHSTNSRQLLTLVKLNKIYDVDFWSPMRCNSNHIDIMVAPKHEVMVKKYLHSIGLKYLIHNKDVGRFVKQEQHMQSLAPRVPRGKISFTQFHRFDTINEYLDQLAQDYSNIVILQSIGKSYEGRDLKIIKISTDPSANKPIIFVDAGIHAREWIAPAMALYIIQELVENSTNSDLLLKVDWHILPVMNPDGYEHTHISNRFWRKTRSPQGICIGTDPNRNFGYHWGETDAIRNPCSDVFIGPTAFSEVETQHVRDYILSLQDQAKLYLTLHSFGNYLLYPWGFTSDLPEDEPELRSLAELVNKAIVKGGGDPYTIGTSENVFYPNSGGSDDWAKGAAGIQLSYTIELSSKEFGFSPLPSQIIPFVKLFFHGIRAYGQYVDDKFGQK